MIREYARRLYRELMPLLYARTNYKLFLRGTFSGFDELKRSVLAAANVLPAAIKPIAVRAPFGRSMLVVAPHQDDELIGCGGAMLLQRQSGGRVAVVFTQDGGDEYQEDGRSREEQVKLRNWEAQRVAREMGIDEPVFLGFERMDAAHLIEVAAGLRAQIERVNADVVFTPFILDPNIHHRQTNYALAQALSSLQSPPKVIGYEVWSLTIPNIILNIDAVMPEKQRLLAFYQSQLSGKDYVHTVTGLNMYHSVAFAAGECRYAERFFEIPAADFIEVMRAIRADSTIQ